MPLTANAVETNKGIEQLKGRLKTTWMTGDYGLFSRYMENGAEEFFARLGVTPGTQLLDVACGAGQIALLAGRGGASVTSCDIATNWLEQGQKQTAAEGIAGKPAERACPLVVHAQPSRRERH